MQFKMLTRWWNKNTIPPDHQNTRAQDHKILDQKNTRTHEHKNTTQKITQKQKTQKPEYIKKYTLTHERQLQKDSMKNKHTITYHNYNSVTTSS